MVYISRRAYFNAAHKLYNDAWTLQENQDVYGVCANEYWHGHNFELIVTVKGNPHPQSQWVMDMKKLGALIKTHVTEKLDHRNMNIDVDFMQGKIPTCEVLVIEIWKILFPLIPVHSQNQATLHKIQLFETHNNFVEYYGE